MMCCGSLAAAGALPQFDRVLLLGEPRGISDATLTDQDGEPFLLSALRGTASLVFFGFTNCPDVCPIAMAKLRQLETSGSVDPDEVSFVLISVDGERDTPETMKNFLRTYSENFIGLTAEPERVQKIAREFRASFYKGSATAPDADYTVAHSTQMFLLDPAGRLRAELHNPDVDDMAELTNAVLEEASVHISN